MALKQTTLSSAITATKLFNIALTDCTGFGDKQAVKIDNEYMWQVGAPSVSSGPGVITVRMRGAEGTPAVAHDVLAAVVTSINAQDFPAVAAGTTTLIPTEAGDSVTIGQDQTLAVPYRSTTFTIAKASAAAITLLAPTLAQVGTTLTFISGTAFAHTITFAGGFFGAGAVNTVLTLPAVIGSTVVIEVGTGGKLVMLGSAIDALDVTQSA